MDVPSLLGHERGGLRVDSAAQMVSELPIKHEKTHQKDATAQHIFQICPMVFALLHDFG